MTLASYVTSERVLKTSKDRYIKTSSILGRGGQAIVQLRIRDSDKARCAVKKIKKSKKNDTSNVHLELSILKKLSRHNKYFAKLLDYKETQKNYYLVFDYYRGGTLREYINNLNINKKGFVDEIKIKKIFHQLARGVKLLHKKKIIHRDLKPKNILFKKEDHEDIVIIDFGISILKTCEKSIYFKGTPAYIAPEVLTGNKWDSKVDCWALGVILYECLSGQHPFCSDRSRRNINLIYNNITRRNINFNTSSWITVSNEAKDLIRRLLTIDPRQRIGARQILNHPWMKSIKKPIKIQKTNGKFRQQKY